MKPKTMQLDLGISPALDSASVIAFVRKSRFASAISLAVACLVLGLGAAGCSLTGKSGTGGSAMVELHGNTPGQIRDVTVQVFRENGYLVAATNPAAMMFQKTATGMDVIAYGSWLDKVWVRVEASIVSVPEAEAAFRLQCRVRLIRDPGAMEEVVPHANIKSAPYQEILNEVAKRLGKKGG